MNIFSLFGKAAIWFDKFVNYTIGKCNCVWSHSGGRKNETISSSLGVEEAEKLYALWLDMGAAVYDLTDITIEREHLLGEFSSDLCDIFQKFHALRSINWDKNPQLEAEHPGVKELVHQFLKHKGIEE